MTCLHLNSGISGLTSLTSDNNPSQGIDALDLFFADFSGTLRYDGEIIRGYTREANRVADSRFTYGDWIGARRYLGPIDTYSDYINLEIHTPSDQLYSSRGGWVYSVAPVPVPEPPAFLLFLTGILGLGIARIRIRNK